VQQEGAGLELKKGMVEMSNRKSANLANRTIVVKYKKVRMGENIER